MNQAAKSKKAAKKQPAKSTKKATVGAQAPRVAPAKGKASIQATAPKRTPTPRPGTKKTNSKATQIVELLNRPGGATLADLMNVTEWQAHSVRGFLSGTLRKKMKLNVQLEKSESGDKSYSILS
jgi:hypothetical protein